MDDLKVNGWNIWRNGSDWVVARIDDNGNYISDEIFTRRDRAVKYAETHDAPDCLLPADEYVALIQAGVR